MMLLGYYSLMPNLQPDLAEVLAAIRRLGCRTALDAAGSGGTLQPLDRILPHLDVYVPSLAEAVHQTNQTDPRRIVEVFRNCGAPACWASSSAVKGALLSPVAGEYVDIPCVPAAGARGRYDRRGRCFYAGLLTGLLRGMTVQQAGRLAAAAGACCVTGFGATAGLRGYQATAAWRKLPKRSEFCGRCDQ